MLYTIIILAALAAIVFFHYLEGLFSATLSAIFAVIAAVVAVGYHEWIVESLLGGRFAAESHALVLMILFAVTYLVLRVVFDRFVKGNVRVPFIVDKVGAAVMGLVAGIFALGVVTIAAEELPFGPDIAGYHRYALSDDRKVDMRVSGFRNDQTPTVSGELASDDVGRFDPTQVNHVFPAVDDVVVNTVAWLSHGSLAGTRLTNIHPDLLQELFAQRLGMQAAANHSALNLTNGPQQVSVSAVYTVSSARLDKVFDQYDPKLRAHPLTEIDTIKHLDKEKKDQMLLVVRMKVSADAADKDGYFRFSPSNIRLVAPQRGEADVAPGDYYPIGTLENDKLYVDKPDDYLFLNSGGDRAVDLVFMVDRWTPATQLPDNAFLEVKRLARVDLSNKKIDPEPPAQPGVGKQALVGVIHVSSGDSQAPPPPTPGHPTTTPATPPSTPPGTPPGGTPPPTIASGGVLDVQDVSFTSDLPQRVGMSAAEAKRPRGSTVNDGQADLRDGQARSLALSGAVPAAQIAQGEAGVTQLAPPHGQVLLRIHAKPAGDNSWAWVKTVGGLAVTDAAGTTHKAKGAWANFTVAGVPHIAATYSSQYDMDVLPALDGVVTDIFIYVPVPPGTVLQQVTLDGKPIKDLQGVNVPQPGQSPQPPQKPQSGNPMAPQSLVPGAGGGGVLDTQDAAVSTALPQRIGATADEAKKKRGTVVAGGTVDLSDGKVHGLSIDGSELAADLGKGDVGMTDLLPPPGQTLVRITAKPGGDNTWEWTKLVSTGSITVVDVGGSHITPKGVWVTITAKGADHVLAQYSIDYALQIAPVDGAVTSVVFYFAVPKGTVLKEFSINDKRLKDLTGLDTSQ